MRHPFCLVLILCYHAYCFAAWTPPEHPSPSAILNEAQSDTKAQRYEDALAKFGWYHENALKYEMSQAGVRLSFALGSFGELAKVYPPAMEKLKSYRDQAGKDVLARDATPGNPLDAFRKSDPFMDFEAINRELGETTRTVELFKQLDQQKPEVAAVAFQAAKSDLIAAKEFKLCGKYMKADASYEQLVGLYHMQKGLATDPRMGKHLADYNEKSFSQGVATLVAVLVQTGQKTEAEQVVQKALKEKDDPTFKALLDKSLAGEMPPKWP